MGGHGAIQGHPPTQHGAVVTRERNAMSMTRYNEERAHPCHYGTISREQGLLLMGIASGVQGVGTHALEFGTLFGVTATNIARMLPNHTVLTCSLPVAITPRLASSKGELEHYPKELPTFPEDVRGRVVHISCDSALLELPP